VNRRLRYRIFAAVTAVLGVALSSAVFLLVRRVETSRVHGLLDGITRDYAEALKHELDTAEAVLDTLADHRRTAGPWDDAEFARVAGPLVRHFTSLRALGWAPRVVAADRPAFPLTFLEPIGTYPRAPGFDLASDPNTSAALQAALASGDDTIALVAGPPGGGRDRHTLAVLVPVYRGGPGPHDARGRAAALDGYCVGFLDVPTVIGAVPFRSFASAVEVTVLDEVVPDPAAPPGGPAAGDRGRLLGSGPREGDDGHLAQSFAFGGRRWRVLTDPQPAFLASHGSWWSLASLAGCLLFTALAWTFVRHYGRRSAALTETCARLRHEVDQRERAEADLSESERFVRATIDAMHAMVAVLDGEGVVVATNRAWRTYTDRIAGREGACDVGANFLALCDAATGANVESVRRVASGIRNVVGGSGQEIVIEIQSREKPAWFLCRITRLAGDGPVRVLVMHQDVTPLKHALREMEKAKEHFETLSEASPVGVFRTDAQGLITYVNERLLEIADTPPEALLGAKWMDLIHLDDRERVDAKWTTAVLEGRTDEQEFRGVRADGTVLVCSVRWRAVRDAAGDLAGFVGTVLDVTAARRTEEVLRALTLAPALGSDAFFETLVLKLSAVLGVEYAEVAVLADDDPTRARTIAVAADGALMANFEYALAGTPCAGVIAGDFCMHPRETRRRFPDDPLLQDLGIEAYGGIPLRDSNGCTMGLLAVLGRRPFGDPVAIEPMLRLFAGRTASELERRRRERALRLAEFSVEHASVAMVWNSADARIIRANRAAREMIGYDQAELDQLRAYDVNLDLSPEAFAAVWQELREERAFRMESRLRRKDGHVLLTESDVDLVEFEGCEYAIASIRDITERRRMEDALRASEERFRTLAESAPMGIFLASAEGTCVYSNSQAAEIYGIDRDEAVGMEWAVPVHPDDRSFAERSWRDAMEQGVPYDVELRVLTRSGAVRWVRVLARPIVLGPEGDGGFLATIVDVTQRKTAEEEIRALNVDLERRVEERTRALAAANARWRAILDSAPNMIVTTDLTGVVRSFSPGAERMLGWRADEVVGRHTPALWLADAEPPMRVVGPSRAIDRPHLACAERLVVGDDGPTATQRDCTFVARDGRRFPALVVLSTLRDEDGAVAGLLGIATDIGDRVRAEQERDRFFTIALDLLCIAGTDGYLKRVNPAFSRTLGYGEEELLARPFVELVHPDDRAATLREVERLAAGERVLHFDNRCRHRDGSWRWLSWRAVPEDDGLVYATARDVTELKRAEAELQRSAAELRDLYDRAPCGYHSLDAEGLFVAVNETELGWLGYERDELVGTKRILDVLTPASQRLVREIFPSFTQQGWIKDLELEMVRKDGSILPVSLSATAHRDASGRYVESRSTIFDITERRRAQARLEALHETLAERAAALEVANRELESFSYSVSHDLRAPLRAIGGFARILHDDLDERLDVTSRRHLLIIRENVSRMSHLIDALLGLSRLGREALVQSPVCMTTIARAAVDEIRSADPARSISVDVGTLAPAVGDPALLQQVLTNLVENAFKYTRPVPHPHVEVGSVEHDDATVYYVRDNGVGFDMRHASKLFGVFERLHGTNEFEGAGVGLAVVHRIIERHGGRVWAEGRVGEGATFFFTLGADQASSTAVDAPGAASHPAGG
jgi:PAS domain S-box-containing protein